MEEKSFLYILLPLFLIDSCFFRDLVKRAVFLLGENPNSFSFFSNDLHIELSSETTNSYHCTEVGLLKKQNC